MNYTIEQLMIAWEDAAVAMWEERHIVNHVEVTGIRDTQRGYPGDIDRIGAIFRRAAPWALNLMGGTYNEKHDASAWCGHFQSNCGLSVGDHLEPDRCVGVYLDPDIASTCLPSTRRMTYLNKWRKAGHTAPDFIPWGSSMLDDQRRHLRDRLQKALETPRVATISAREYGDARDKVGGHFVLITALNENDTFDTIEGNGWGLLGNGEYGEGVVKRFGEGTEWDARPLEDLRRVYLFDVEHFEFMGRP